MLMSKPFRWLANSHRAQRMVKAVERKRQHEIDLAHRERQAQIAKAGERTFGITLDQLDRLTKAV